MILRRIPGIRSSVYITEGNYIAFRDKYGKDRLYTIMSIEGDEEWTVHCEDIGLDLINEYAVPWDYTARSIEDTLSVVLHDSGWEIGINEVSSYKRSDRNSRGLQTASSPGLGMCVISLTQSASLPLK